MNRVLRDALEALPLQHQSALRWFVDNAGSVQHWPGQLPDGTLLATKAKGIYKPRWSKYALSIRQTLGGPYPDKEPVNRDDGTWRYEYFQEGNDPTARDAEFTNKGLMNCWRDHVPVGVMRQVSGKPNVRYLVLGVALVASWDSGYFRLEGFSKDGSSMSTSPSAQLKNLENTVVSNVVQTGSFDPSNMEDAREWIMQAVVMRRGQPAFRSKLLATYNSTCVVTGCRVEAALEAAHIVPYQGPETNCPSNGLLLRADIRTLFDLGQLAVNENDKTVILVPDLRVSMYRELEGCRIQDPDTTEAFPSESALRAHRTWAGLLTESEQTHRK